MLTLVGMDPGYVPGRGTEVGFHFGGYEVACGRLDLQRDWDISRQHPLIFDLDQTLLDACNQAGLQYEVDTLSNQ